MVRGSGSQAFIFAIAVVFLSTKAGLRFFRMAEALARRGYEVDIVLNRATAPVMLEPRSREVPFKFVRWATIT